MSSLYVPDYQQQAHYKYPSFKQKIAIEGKPTFGRVAFWYENSLGEITSRVVDTKARLGSSRDLYLMGHCHLRGESRVFHSGGSWDVRDIVTGATFDSLGQWAESSASITPIELHHPTEQDILNWTRMHERDVYDEALKLGLEFVRDINARCKGWSFSVFNPTSLKSDCRFDLYIRSIKKDGSVSKAPYASIWYVEADTRYLMMDGKEVECSKRHRPRPWQLIRRTKTIGYFSRFNQLKEILLPMLKL